MRNHAIFSLPIVLLAACATAHSPSQYQLAFERAELSSGSAAEGDAVYMLPGVQVDPVLPAEDAVELQAVVSELAAAVEACPTFDERLMWLDCHEAPCHVYLWGGDPLEPEPFEAVSCEADLGARYVGHVEFGADKLLRSAVYMIDDSDAEPTPIDAVHRRFREVHDTVFAQLIERAAEPS